MLTSKILEGFSRVEREHRYPRRTRTFKAREIVTIATEIVDKTATSVVEYSWNFRRVVCAFVHDDNINLAVFSINGYA